jgi:tRNA G18 (ribose-2'-O)-methylase SpoU
MLQNNYKENTPDNLQRIVDIAKTKGIAVKYLAKERLDKFTGGRPHNGVVLKSESREYVYIKSFDKFIEKYIHKSEGNLLVLLDQIVDPQNFGSIIRSAFFLGTDAILVNRRNRPPMSSSVSKVSAGASECTELFAIRPVKNFLADAMSKGWIVISTSIEKEHDVQLRLPAKKNEKEEENKEQVLTNLTETKNISLTELNISKTSNVILVMGSEANGITNYLKGVCNYNIYIPPLLNKELTGQSPFNIIDSLNVGVSAGIIMSHVKSQLKIDSKTTSEYTATVE